MKKYLPIRTRIQENKESRDHEGTKKRLPWKVSSAWKANQRRKAVEKQQEEEIMVIEVTIKQKECKQDMNSGDQMLKDRKGQKPKNGETDTHMGGQSVNDQKICKGTEGGVEEVYAKVGSIGTEDRHNMAVDDKEGG